MPLALAAYPGSGQNATLALTLIAKVEEAGAKMRNQQWRAQQQQENFIKKSSGRQVKGGCSYGTVNPLSCQAGRVAAAGASAGARAGGIVA